MVKKSSQSTISYARGATNACLRHPLVDTFIAPRRDEMTIEMSYSDRHTNSKTLAAYHAQKHSDMQ